MIQLNKRLWLSDGQVYSGKGLKQIAIIGHCIDGKFNYDLIPWNDVLKGRTLARKRKFIYPFSRKQGHTARFTKLGRAMLKFTQ